MFKELGVDVIVGGGQTMNPSTEDFVKALEKVHAKHVFIYPNNSNIVMAASQACEVIDNTKTVGQVVPSKTILQGITSLMQFSPDLSPEDNFDNMKSALKDVKSGSVTYAIKDTDIDGVHITKDYYMAMADDKSIISCVPDKFQSLNDIIDALVDEDSYMITVIYGQDVSANEEKEIKMSKWKKEKQISQFNNI